MHQYTELGIDALTNFQIFLYRRSTDVSINHYITNLCALLRNTKIKMRIKKFTFDFHQIEMLLSHLFPQDEWRFLLAGGSHKPKELPNPAHDWLSERSWGDILTLPALPKFAEFATDFPNHLSKYKELFDSPDPHKYV